MPPCTTPCCFFVREDDGGVEVEDGGDNDGGSFMIAVRGVDAICGAFFSDSTSPNRDCCSSASFLYLWRFTAALSSARMGTALAFIQNCTCFPVLLSTPKPELVSRTICECDFESPWTCRTLTSYGMESSDGRCAGTATLGLSRINASDQYTIAGDRY